MFVSGRTMPGKDKKVELRRCVELLTELLEHEGSTLSIYKTVTYEICHMSVNLAEQTL